MKTKLLPFAFVFTFGLSSPNTYGWIEGTIEIENKLNRPITQVKGNLPSVKIIEGEKVNILPGCKHKFVLKGDLAKEVKKNNEREFFIGGCLVMKTADSCFNYMVDTLPLHSSIAVEEGNIFYRIPPPPLDEKE